MWSLPLQCYQQPYTLPKDIISLSWAASASWGISPAAVSFMPGSPQRTYPILQSLSALPCPYMNHLKLLGEMCFAATMAIALSLGISRSSYINDHPSPFPLTPLMSHAHIPPDLQPTFEQRTLVHPCYLDCIIFPHFRSRAIELSGRGELDHCSLFLDLMHDGLVCWGSQYACTDDGTAMNASVPWSRYSWEAKPWFLEKWSVLLDEGDSDGIRSIRRSWSTSRGEDESAYIAVEEVGSVFSRHGGCNVGVRQISDDPLLW